MNRNKVVGIFAHVDAGKTSLTEAVLYQAGVVKKQGRVDHGDAFLDTHPLERERGITIFSKQAMFTVGDTQYTLIDTPGHVDFAAEMERTAAVLDYAVLVVNAMRGVQSHTETIWKLLAGWHIPVMLFINKMDWPEASPDVLMAEIREKLGEGCIASHGLICGTAMPDSFCSELSLEREEWLEAYLEDGYSADKWFALAQEEFQNRRLFPCFFGSALLGEGVEEWFQSFCALTQAEPDSQNESFADMGAERGTGARVFKILYDKQGNRLTFLKVTMGILRVKDVMERAGKVNQIRLYSGERFETAELAGPGCLCAVTGLSGTVPGEALGLEHRSFRAECRPILSAKVFFPEGYNWKTALEQMKRLEEEQPELNVTYREELSQIELQVMGEIQLEVIKELFMERYGTDIHFGPCGILYKETIQAPVTGYGHFEPLRHYAEVHVRLEPSGPGTGITAAGEVSVNELDKNYQNLVRTHILEKEHKGVLTGSALTDVRIILTAGRAHIKHTEGGDFREATYRAIRQGLQKAESVLLEPYYRIRAELPFALTGRVAADIRKRYGETEPPVMKNESTAIVCGKVPAESFGDYPLEFVQFTKGNGNINFEFLDYEPCHNAVEVIEKIGYDRDRDAENPSGSMFCSHGAGFYVDWREAEQYMHIK